LFGRSGPIKRRALAPARITVKRELWHHQNLTANILDRAVHLPLIGFKDAQPRNFLGQIIRVDLGITSSHSHQNQQAAADFASDLAVDGNFGSAYPLDHRSHALSFEFLVPSFKFQGE
jgi:hypothetical protein